jgi:protein-S-isoprenylcysteine O-methyltransferase Ste14
LLHGSPLNSIEQTRVLVQQGAYRHIRHPLYTSLILLTWGIFLKRPDVAALGLSLGSSAFLMAAALFEERLSLDKFGDSYRRYMQETKRFFPFLY